MNRRRCEWTIVLGALGMATLAFSIRGSASQKGDTRTVQFTIVPSDRWNLGCTGFEDGRFRCWSAGADPKGFDTSPNRLAPFVTTSGELVVMSGVFSHASVLKEVMRRRHLVASEQRFVVTCSARVLSAHARPGVRFSRTAAFHAEENGVQVLETESCRVFRSND